ncbi:MAG: Rpn family recombination-promoting nuclease/putative transposase [Lachnospiraceae bacterium]|nr:Rpn family recombination-promoting nuclease/putative transposase [Lachnospiraceae bacterium]
MSVKDTVTKDFMADSRVFADVFNQLIYEGNQVIQPEKLHPLDSVVASVPYGADGAEIPTQRLRDGLKYLTAMEDDSAVYLLLGVENQTEVHYAMPVRDMLYDALQYAAQVEKAARSHKEARKAKDTEELAKNPNSGEYLSGFYKEDRLIPVITLVVYFGVAEWDGPRSLHEMLTVTDRKILSFVSDYKLNLIAPAHMTDEEMDRFTTNLREVLLFIKYSKDKAKLNDMLNHDERFRTLDRKAAAVIRTVTGSKIEMYEEEEDVDVCQAIQEMMDDAKMAGREEGILNERTAMAMRMLGRGKYSYEEISELSRLTVEEVQALDEKRKNQ